MTIKDHLDSQASYIIDSYLSGKSTSVLGREFGCNSGDIWQLLDKNGVDIRKREGYGKLADSATAIKQRFEDGHSAYAIALDMKVQASSIVRLLKKMGCDTKRGNRKRDDPLHDHVDAIVSMYQKGMSTCKIASTFRSSNSSVWRLLAERGIKRRLRSIYTNDESFFDVINNQEKAYVLGWFYSDGNNMKNRTGIRLQITDLEILQKIKKVMKCSGPILATKKTNPKHATIYTLAIHSKKISAGLELKGCPPAKTFLLRFPDVSIVPLHLLSHFVRGYFDGDGSFGCNGKARRWRIQIVGTRHLTDGILLSSKVHGVFVKRHPERENDNWTLMIHRKDAMKTFLDWLYADATIFLARKHAKYLEFLSSLK